MRPLSLTARVTLALALVGVVPLAVAVWSLFDVNRDAIGEQVLRTHTLAAATAAERIASFVETRRSEAVALASNARVTDDPRGTEATEFLQQFLVSNAIVQAIVITTPANELVIRIQQRGVGTFPPLSKAGVRMQKEQLSVTAPFDDGRGFVHVYSDAAPILAALDPTEIGEHAEIVLASRGGVVAGRSTLEPLPPALIAAASSARINGSTVYRDTHDVPVTAAYAAVSGTDWFVVSRQPSAHARRIARTMQRRAAIAVALALLLAGVLGFVAQRTVVRPIREVVRAQQQLAGGTSKAHGGGEIDQLREAAELLTRRISDQDDLGRVFLGRYQVLGLIGQGGMGTVFRGWDPKLRRHVALKTIRVTAALGVSVPEAVSLLVGEAVVGAGLNHPNIVQVYDVEESAGAAFIAMELVEGFSLESHLGRHKALTCEQTVVIGIAVANALAAAHGRGLVHRDIKPANVLLGYDDSVKVADFGLAELVSTAVTADGMVFGTPGYIAPECVTGNPATEKSDLFSLGVMLYECATGRNPFARAIVRESFLATLDAPVHPLGEVLEPSEAMIPLAEIIGSLMSRIPENRPASAAVAAERLGVVARYFDLQWHLELEAQTSVADGARRSRSNMPTIILERAR